MPRARERQKGLAGGTDEICVLQVKQYWVSRPCIRKTSTAPDQAHEPCFAGQPPSAIRPLPPPSRQVCAISRLSLLALSRWIFFLTPQVGGGAAVHSVTVPRFIAPDWSRQPAQPPRNAPPPSTRCSPSRPSSGCPSRPCARVRSNVKAGLSRCSQGMPIWQLLVPGLARSSNRPRGREDGQSWARGRQ